MKKIVVGSRESALAVAQSKLVIDSIYKHNRNVEVVLKTMKTTGDKVLDKKLDSIGGKGLFVKELDLALQDKKTDISVHSLKDVPMELPDGLPLICFSKREDPRDVLVLPKGKDKPDPALPIGSSSLRRIIQLKKIFPGYDFEPVRGNLQTRLKKLDEGQYGALVLAAAGMKRMSLESRISRYFEVDEVIPAAGQGIIAVQGREGEDFGYLEDFADMDSYYAAVCERAYVTKLDGGCTSPVCAHATVKDNMITLNALYYEEDTGEYCTGTITGSTSQAREHGIELAVRLRDEMRSWL